MPYAVELFFDADLDHRVRQVCKVVSDRIGHPDSMTLKGSRPHLALAVFDDTQMDRTLAVVQDLAKTLKAFEIQLNSVGTFPGAEGVLFLAPRSDQALTEAHDRCQGELQGLVQGMWDHYLVGNFVFHCTLTMGLAPVALEKAVAVAREISLPLMGRVVAVGLVKFPDVTFLGDFRLVGDETSSLPKGSAG